MKCIAETAANDAPSQNMNINLNELGWLLLNTAITENSTFSNKSFYIPTPVKRFDWLNLLYLLLLCSMLFWFGCTIQLTSLYFIIIFQPTKPCAVSIVRGSILITSRLNLAGWFNLFLFFKAAQRSTALRFPFSRNGIIRQILSRLFSIILTNKSNSSPRTTSCSPGVCRWNEKDIKSAGEVCQPESAFLTPRHRKVICFSTLLSWSKGNHTPLTITRSSPRRLMQKHNEAHGNTLTHVCTRQTCTHLQTWEGAFEKKKFKSNPLWAHSAGAQTLRLTFTHTKQISPPLDVCFL